MKRKGFGYVVLTAICMGIFLTNHFLNFAKPADYPAGICYARAKVTKIVWEEMGRDPDYVDMTIGKQLLGMKITSGEFRGKHIEAYNYVERTMPRYGRAGDTFIVASYDDFVTSMIIGYDRSLFASVFLLAFLGLIVVVGRMKGVRSIVSLGFTLICVCFLLIPLILKGIDPIIAAVIVAVLSTAATFGLICGFDKKSISASLSCILSCMIAGIYAVAFSKLTHITTLNTPEAENLLFITENAPLKIQNLLIAGILIASMGAIMDVSMSMVSSLYELKECNPEITRGRLIRSGFRIGSDIMGTMTNTLILAFAGGSINTLFVLFLYRTPPFVLVNMDLIVIELIRGLSGSVGVICAVPISVLVCAWGIKASP